MKHTSWGNSFSNDQISLVLDRDKIRLKDQSCEVNYFEKDNILAENMLLKFQMVK